MGSVPKLVQTSDEQFYRQINNDMPLAGYDI